MWDKVGSQMICATMYVRVRLFIACKLLPTHITHTNTSRQTQGAAAAIDARRRELAYLAALLLALVPWTQVSRTVADGVALAPASLALVGAAGVGVHLCFLALNTVACAALRLGGGSGGSGSGGGGSGSGEDAAAVRGVRRAVVLTASVKTLPVAVAVLASLAPALGAAAGVAVVPCMMAHLAQIVIDSALVARWKAADAAEAGPEAGRGKAE